MSGLDSSGLWTVARALSILERCQQGDPAIRTPRGSSRFDRAPVVDLLASVVLVCDSASIRTRWLDMARALKSEIETSRSGAMPNPVSPPEAERARQVAVGLRAELEVLLEQRKFAEPVEPDGLVNYQKLRAEGIRALVDGASAAVIWSLPPAIQADLTEATRALLSNVPTGSTFLALRAAEGMAQEAMRSLFPSDTKRLSWDETIKRITPEFGKYGVDDEQVQAYMTFLRLLRNKAAHPGTSFSPKDAEKALQNAAHLAVILSPLKNRARSEESSAADRRSAA